MRTDEPNDTFTHNKLICNLQVNMKYRMRSYTHKMENTHIKQDYLAEKNTIYILFIL